MFTKTYHPCFITSLKDGNYAVNKTVVDKCPKCGATHQYSTVVKILTKEEYNNLTNILNI